MIPEYLVERAITALDALAWSTAEANAIAREQNDLLRRIALAAEESARNNPLRQINDILAASAPEEMMR
jgi:hypothetical protein